MEYRYIVAESGMVTPTTFSVTMYAQNPRRIMPYKPGQYAAVSFQSHNRPSPIRCFSIVSTPLSPGWLQFAMRVKGDYTQAAAHKIKPGDVLTVEGPFGGFVINPYQDRSTVLVAGGIGITPFMSMVRTNIYGTPTSQMLLIYSCHDQTNVPFADELIAATRTSPFLRVIFVISEGPVDRFVQAGMWVVQGRLTRTLLDQLLEGKYDKRSYFLCGPEAFMETVDEALRSQGVPRRRITTEVFSQRVPQTSVLLGRPSQIYALTALGLLAATGMVFNQDLKVVAAKAQKAELSAKQAAAAKAIDPNKRQKQIDETIAELKALQSQGEDQEDEEENQEKEEAAEKPDSQKNPSPSPPPSSEGS